MLEERAKRAAEQLLDDSSVTEDLDDAEASSLLSWGVAVSKRLAEQTQAMDDNAADEFIAMQMQALRRVVRRINRLVGSLSVSPTPDEISGELQSIFEAASAVPGLPVQPPLDANAAARSVQMLSPGDALDRILSFFSDRSSDGEEA